MLDGGQGEEIPDLLCGCTQEKIALVKMGDEKSFGSAHRLNRKLKIWEALERTLRYWGQGWKGDEGRGMERYQM